MAHGEQIDGLCAEVFGPGGDVFVIVLEVPALGAGLRGLADLQVGHYRMKEGPVFRPALRKRRRPRSEDEQQREKAPRHGFAPGGASNSRATRLALLRMALTALVMVIEARDTASTSCPSLNGSRTSLPLNCAPKAGRSIEKSPYGS